MEARRNGRMILCAAPSPDDKRVYALHALVPGNVLRAAEVRRCAGGKGVNAARALGCVGAECALVSFAGPAFRALLLGDLPGSVSPRIVSTRGETRSCATLHDRATGADTEIVEEAVPVHIDEAEAFEAAVRGALADAAALVLAGSLPSGCPPDLYARLMHGAVGRACPVVVDAHGAPLISALPARPALVKINADEALDALALLGRPAPADRDAAVDAALRALIDAGAQAAAVSDGAGPVRAIDATGAAWTLRPPRVHAVSAVGCGDAMTGGVALGLARGEALPAALARGIAMAAAAAETALPAQLHPDRAEALRLRVEIIPGNTML